MSPIPRKAMSRKTIIIVGLAAGVVAAALVFDGVSRRRAGNSGPAISQNPVTTTPPAGGSANSSNAGTEVQPAVPPAATGPAAEPGQNPVPGADAQAPADENAAAAAQALVVPVGTTLTVRLGEELGSKTSEAGQSFSATLDQDVVVDGQTAIAAGANVTGKVVFARPVGALAGEASLQLKVTSINVNNADLEVVTSVRSFGPKIKGKNKVGRFMKGLAKRSVGDEREVVLDEQSAYSFTLRRPLQIQ